MTLRGGRCKRTIMGQKVKILYAEDSPGDSELTLRELDRQGLDNDCLVVSDLARIEELLGKEPFDILLSDSALRKFCAKDLLGIRDRLAPELPVIIVTGTLPDEQAVDLLKLGAADYVRKDRLARLPAVITRALAEKEERQKLDRAKQARKLEAIGRLAGGIAHDFNNILGAIEGYATLGLRKLDESDQLWADLTDIRKAVARASALTKQLLVFSRKHALHKEPVCPAELIDNLQKMVKRIIGEYIAVSLEVAPGLPSIMADAGQLEQLLMNLFINARDAMPGGGVIKITAGLVIPEPQKVRAPNPASAGTQFLRIAVADTGTGMPPSVVEHLFEPFFTTKEKGKGTGLGLSTVYGIASQHNGWLEVVTAEGKGSEFSVFLPAGASVPVLSAPELPAVAAVGRGGGARLLIVEDDEDLRKMAVKALEVAGYSTVSASSVAEAVSVFRNAGGAFDLVFSDMVLHDGNATQLIAVLLGIKPGLKFVFTSGYRQPDDTMGMIEDGGYKFLGKPYAIERLVEAIEGCLKN